MLLVVPWSPFWFRNAFSQYPLVAELLENPFVRGGVSGIGLITALAGLAELGGAFSHWRREPRVPSPE